MFTIKTKSNCFYKVDDATATILGIPCARATRELHTIHGLNSEKAVWEDLDKIKYIPLTEIEWLKYK